MGVMLHRDKCRQRAAYPSPIYNYFASGPDFKLRDAAVAPPCSWLTEVVDA